MSLVVSLLLLWLGVEIVAERNGANHTTEGEVVERLQASIRCMRCEGKREKMKIY